MIRIIQIKQAVYTRIFCILVLSYNVDHYLQWQLILTWKCIVHTGNEHIIGIVPNSVHSNVSRCLGSSMHRPLPGRRLQFSVQLLFNSSSNTNSRSTCFYSNTRLSRWGLKIHCLMTPLNICALKFQCLELFTCIIIAQHLWMYFLFVEHLRTSYLLFPGPSLYKILVLCGKCRPHPLRLPAHQNSNKLLQVVSFHLKFSADLAPFWVAKGQKTKSVMV